MKASFKTFFIQLFIFSLLSFTILFVYNYFAPQRFQTNLGWGIGLFFVVSTALIHYILIKVSEQNPKNFVTYFMAITGIKLFVYLIIIIAFALLMREQALGFSICFLLMYFLYTSFEVFVLLKHFKK